MNCWNFFFPHPPQMAKCVFKLNFKWHNIKFAEVFPDIQIAFEQNCQKIRYAEKYIKKLKKFLCGEEKSEFLV